MRFLCKLGIHRYRTRPEWHTVPEVCNHVQTGRWVRVCFHIGYCTRCNKREFSRGM